MAALQWFEYHNKLDVDPDRLEHQCQRFDAYHLKTVPNVPGQTYMHGVVAESLPASSEPELVISLSRADSLDDVISPIDRAEFTMADAAIYIDGVPETLPGTDSEPVSSPPSAEVTHGSR